MPRIYKIVDALRDAGIPRKDILAVLETLRPLLTDAEIASFQWRVDQTER